LIRVSEIKIPLEKQGKGLKVAIAKKLKVNANEIKHMSIFRESIDARNKSDIKLVYVVDVALEHEGKLLKRNPKLTKTPDMEYKPVLTPEQTHRFNDDQGIVSPIIVGAGPAGLFAGLILAEAGLKPLIIERGEMVEDRTKTVNQFWEEGLLNVNSNVQFGEGGAGTFSDGKLTTRIKDLRGRRVLEELVESGAPEEILYKNKPHIGTDILKPTIVNFRKKIEAAGGRFLFNKTVTDIIIEDGRISAVEVNGKEVLKSDHVILAIGHSARDTFEVLHKHHVDIEQKPFAIGVRIEHPQEMIDIAQYGSGEVREYLGAADYHLTHQTGNGRGVYTFCMCPGGVVVGASSEENTVVVNGMSEFARDNKNANSALLVTVGPEDFGSEHPLAGMYFQRKWEEKAFEVGGSDYSAPAQRVGDFLKDKGSELLNKQVIDTEILPTYLPKVKYAELSECLPMFVVDAMKEALVKMNNRLKGFAASNAVMTGIEARSSSPIRIRRDRTTCESLNIKGLFPCGEGAGYAGGIVSSAVDGINVAEKVIVQKLNDLEA